MRREPLELRFWSKVTKEKQGCWVWTGSKDGKGYGMIRVDRYTHKRVHILSYEWYYGTVLPGMEIDHTCRNRSCVNPRHLEVVTHAENIRRIRERVPYERPKQCVNGHALTEETLHVTATRWRCRVCAREKTARHRERRANELRPLPQRPEQCYNGHQLNEGNASVVDGSWRCKVCVKEAQQRYRERQKVR